MSDTTAMRASREAPLAYFKRTWRQNIIYIGFVVVFAFFAVMLHDKGFLTPNNILNIARQTAVIAVMAVAMTLVLSSGEIDLSVGAVAGLASVTTAMAVAWGGLPAGIATGILTGVAVGLINGFLSTRLMIPTFLTTLAMMGIAKGTAMWISGTAAIPVINNGLILMGLEMPAAYRPRRDHHPRR